MIESRFNLLAKIATLYADNVQGLISAVDLRDGLRAIAESCFNLEVDRVSLGLLASDVVAVLGAGLDPTKYQGIWTPATNTPTIPAAAGGNSGHWYIASAAGTATGNAAGTYGAGDRIQSNGTIWRRMPTPPTTIPDGSVSVAKLTPELQGFFSPSLSEVYVYALVDGSDRVALGIGPDGRLFGNFVLPAASVTGAQIAAATVTRGNLASSLESMLPQDQTVDPDYVFAIIDQDGRVALGIRPSGELVGRMPPAVASIERVHLGPSLDGLVPESLTSYDYVYAILDQDNRIAFAVKNDGSIVGKWSFSDLSVPLSAMAPASVDASKLTADLSRRVLPSAGDLVPDRSDNLWRGNAVAIPQQTAASGHAFTAFPSFPTPVLYGMNDTGTSLEFRRASGLAVRGNRYRGTWSAATAAPDSAPLPGDHWMVSASGTFAGIPFAGGDRLVALGTTFNGATVAKWAKQKPGEFFHMGEFTPASFTPATTADGDLYVASVAGSFGGFTFAAGDSLARIAGGWRRLPLVDYAVVPAGVPFHFETTNAADIEVRRTDKSTTQVFVTGTGYHTSNPRRNADGVVMWGDSLVAVVGLDLALGLALAPRPVAAFSYSGASSAQILTAVRESIRGGDTHRGKVHIFFHGQNNSGQVLETRRAAFEFANLVGARDGRFLFLSPPGQRAATFNGTRIVIAQHEGALTPGDSFFELDSWYRSAFPGRFLSPRVELVARAASRTTPDLQFPGMTEAQVAAAYNVIPFSYFFNYSIVPWTPEAMSFQGYRSAAGLPTGGADGHYWIRSGGGTVGYIIARWAGVWTEHSYDTTHMQRVGNDVLAQAISEFLTTNNL